MFEGIPIGLLDGLGVAALLVLLFFMLATGRLVTRQTHDDVKADRDVWRDNYLDQKGLMSQLLSGQETTNRLLQALPHVRKHEGDE